MILADIKTAVKFTGEVRRARMAGWAGIYLGHGAATGPRVLWLGVDAGKHIHLQPPHRVRGKQGFAALDESTRHALAFSPQRGEVVARAQFWRELLRPILPPREYRITMTALLQGYAWSIRRRTAATS